jgi:predicted nucleic acid-binding protein
MILLDTNVLSEMYRPRPSEAVRTWFDGQRVDDLYICTPVLAELHHGVERLPAGARRKFLESSIERLEHEEFVDRIVDLDRFAAREFGRIVAGRGRAGRPMQTMDALIAAIALSHRAAIATRDTADFAELDIDLINPFDHRAGRR